MIVIAARQHRHQRRFGGSKQKGVVLLIALIILVAMTLAAIGLVRSVDTGNVIAGNLAFKQGATLAADEGVERGIAYLRPLISGTTLYSNQVAEGYYATSQDALDITGNSNDPLRARVDWNGDACGGFATAPCIRPSPAQVDETTGNSVRYIIHRLCSSEGDSNATDNSCVTFQNTSGSSPKRGELKYGDDKRFESAPGVYYRITARAAGPRNTVSFIETVVHF